MMPSLSFRWWLVCLSLLITLATLSISGTAIYLVRANQLQKITLEQVSNTATSLSLRTENLLANVEQSLAMLLQASTMLSTDDFANLLLSSMRSRSEVRAMYFLNGDGKTFAVWTPRNETPYRNDLMGVDFSLTHLFQTLHDDDQPVWSDTFVSTVVGDVAIGVGIRFSGITAIAELDLPTLLKTVEVAAGPNTKLWVLDRVGEVLADTAVPQSAGVLNLKNETFIDMAFAGKPLPAEIHLQGRVYHPGVSLSKKLGWLFIVGIPSGMGNPLMKNTVIDILSLGGSFLLIAFLVSPMVLHLLVRQLEGLKGLAQKIAEGRAIEGRKYQLVHEFNDLAINMEDMAKRILERESALSQLNQELEQRVLERTHALEDSNQELKQSLEHNLAMQKLLVQTENQAALGRLVAGVSHELNTPIGNAVMAITTLKDEKVALDDKLRVGIRKSELDYFLDQTQQGLEIAERNVIRAAELISSFKQVAVDQTSTARRTFNLQELIDDVLLTLHPMLKRSPHNLHTEVREPVKLDSYPGVVGQILTNLITNALTHAWKKGQAGHITVAAQKIDSDTLRMSVADDGMGIADDIKDKIFEPFFTTRMGRGGTGLGLNIAYNGACNVLGGVLRCEDGTNGGTVFLLEIPLIAPDLR